MEIRTCKYEERTRETEGGERETDCIIMQFRFSFTILVSGLLKTRVGVSASSF